MPSSGSIQEVRSAVNLLFLFVNFRNTVHFFFPASLTAYQFVVCHLLQSTWDRIQHLQRTQKMDAFTARNQSQVYHYRPLSIAYGEALFMQRMVDLIDSPGLKPEIRSVLQALAAMFGTTHLEKHFSVLIEGGYFHSRTSEALHRAVELLCDRLKPEAVALVDALAPSDFVLNSALGHSDGQVYKHLEARMSPSFKARPEWWKLILQLPTAHL